jgi:large repetitive protein
VTITDTISGAMVTANTTAIVDPVLIAIQTRNFAVTGKKNFSGIVATFTDDDPRIDPTFYTATMNWGDGSPDSTGAITGTNPFRVTASHIFPTFQNTDIVTITIVDKNGRTATGVDRVVDPPVDLAIQARGLTLSRNQPFQGIVAAFTDSGPSEPASAY